MAKVDSVTLESVLDALKAHGVELTETTITLTKKRR